MQSAIQSEANREEQEALDLKNTAQEIEKLLANRSNRAELQDKVRVITESGITSTV